MDFFSGFYTFWARGVYFLFLEKRLNDAKFLLLFRTTKAGFTVKRENAISHPDSSRRCSFPVCFLRNVDEGSDWAVLFISLAHHNFSVSRSRISDTGFVA